MPAELTYGGHCPSDRVQATTLPANTSRTPPGDTWVFSPSFDEQKGTTHLPLLRPRKRLKSVGA